MTCHFCPIFTYLNETDIEENKLLNEVIICVFFAHKKYSNSFRKLRLNHWCHIDYFNNVLTAFLGLERGSCIAVYAESENSWISSKISWFVFWWWMKVLWVWNNMGVIKDSIFIKTFIKILFCQLWITLLYLWHTVNTNNNVDLYPL